MAGSALKRLMAEHRQLMKNPPEGIVAGPRGDENYFEWEAHILGPPDTCFEYGVFKAFLLKNHEFLIFDYLGNFDFSEGLSNESAKNAIYQ